MTQEGVRAVATRVARPLIPEGGISTDEGRTPTPVMSVRVILSVITYFARE